MYHLDADVSEQDHVYNRISKWISSHDFCNSPHEHNVDTNLVDGLSDITSVTRVMGKVSNGLVVEERSDEIKCGNDNEEISEHLVQNLTKPLHFPLVEQRCNRTASPNLFSVIAEEKEAVCFYFVHTFFVLFTFLKTCADFFLIYFFCI